MSIFDRQPRLRWMVPAACATLLAGGALAGALGASADSGLAPRSASQLLVDLQQPQVTALSGTIVAKADLGLPSLPTGGRSSAELSALLSGSHTLRLWYDGPARVRLAVIGTAAESDVIRNGRDAWLWSSDRTTADHYTLPDTAPSGARPAVPTPTDLPRTPQEAAERALEAAAGSTAVTTSGLATVAGRSAYELILTPKQSDTLVDRTVIAIDGEKKVPLRVQVFSTAMAEPAYEVGFTAVDFTRPEARMFTFTPPPGTTVTDHAVRVPDAAMGKGGGVDLPKVGADGAKPSVVGTGWSRVVVATLSAEQRAALTGSGSGSSTGGLDIGAILRSVPRTSGAWGSGRVISGTLFSAVLTDDGRVAVGSVAPQALFAALAAR